MITSCNNLNGDLSLEESEAGGRTGSEESSGFGPIIFCKNVTADGVIEDASNKFPEGTGVVWAYFNYWGMDKGKPWGRLWTHDGRVYIDARGEIWEDLNEGWVAYSIGDDYNLVPGIYELTLFINDYPVQKSSFQIVIE
jgi:hypothetical protein